MSNKGNLTKFANILFAEELRNKEETEKQLETEKKTVLRQRIKEIKRQYESDADKYRTECDYELEMAVSKRMAELNSELRRCRDRVSKEVFDDVEKRLYDFVKTDAYKAYLVRKFDSVKAEFNEGNTVCMALDTDIMLIKELCPIENIEIKATDDDIIGGFTLINNELGILADCTIRSDFDEQKDLFPEISGLVIE